MEIFSRHPLSRLNTFGINAFAKEYVEIHSEDDLKYLIKINHDKSRKVLFLGGGSNVLFTGDFDGMVARICTKGMEIAREDDDHVWLRVAAGEEWDGLVEYCVTRGWGGLENLSGIPGLAGSSPIQNIGAYGTELKDHFDSLEAINLCTGEFVTFDAERCQFGYRDSIFKRALKGRVVITHVVFRLQKNPVLNLTYQSLKQQLAKLPDNQITQKTVRDTVLSVRASKLPDPKVTGNAGSFFKNPVISLAHLEDLKSRFPGIAYFEVPTADRRPPTADQKLAAGWLIEQCGWKGYRSGDAGVHKDQALVLVNYGNASGREILNLSEKIKMSVKEKFNVDLEREVNVIM
jgi:UDP-N-acetylmuramate dehydrogenase